MTVDTSYTGAATTCKLDWDAINWRDVEKRVRRLQMRIAKAFQEKKHGKVKALQWVLTHSHDAKLLAIRRVVKNKGAKTPGVDQVIWTTPQQKAQAASTLKRRGYKTLPLRRVYIPKGNGVRALSIPAMKCRAMQALYLLALEPIAERMADKNAYGFRPLRSTADAIGQCFSALAKRGSARYVLEGDIKSCFDTISHSWLLTYVPMDKEILKKWLEAGYIEHGRNYSTTAGTPQGGTISPTLLTITLSGLEQAVYSAISNRRKDKVHLSIYADDFIITGETREVLEERVRPAVSKFLRQRGLSLSKEKTKVTHIEKGFDFLGFNLRKYRGKLLITPSKKSVKSFLTVIRETIRSNGTARQENLIHQLNPKIRGWTNYFRHVCAKKTFSYVSHSLFQALWRWAKRRHPKKSRRWIKQKYFLTTSTRRWVFATQTKQENGGNTLLSLFDAGLVRIRRHTKIRADATPYDPAYIEYLFNRAGHKIFAATAV